jgi:hypothetical protein
MPKNTSHHLPGFVASVKIPMVISVVKQNINAVYKYMESRDYGSNLSNKLIPKKLLLRFLP